MTRRPLLVAVLLGLVLSVTTGLRPAAAQVPDGPAPEYPWTATDPTLTPIRRYEGSTTENFTGTPITVGTPVDVSQGIVMEAWIKSPTDPSGACGRGGYCPAVSFVGGSAFPAYPGQTDIMLDLSWGAYSAGQQGQPWTPRTTRYQIDASGAARTNGATVGLGVRNGQPAKFATDWNLLTVVTKGSGGVDQYVYINGVASHIGLDWTQYTFHPNSPNYKWVCFFGDRDCNSLGSGGAGWSHLQVADARISKGQLTAADLQARRAAIADGTVTGPTEPVAPEPDAFAPRLACGRTMRDMGGGQWVADVQGMVRNPDPDTTDNAGYWEASWEPGVQYPGRNVSLPLPLGATTNSNLYATYVMTRSIPEEDTSGGIAWSPTEEAGGDWRENIEYIPNETGSIIPGWSWVSRLLGMDGSNDPTERDLQHGQGSLTFIGGDGNGRQFTGPTGGGDWIRTVKATCTVRVSPVTATTDPPVVVIVIPDHPDDTGTAEPAPPPPGSEAGDTACAGGSWWNPVTWAKSVFCKLGDLWGLLRELLDWLMDQLGDFTIPGISGLSTEWSSKFPLSLIGEAVGAFGALDDALQSGMGDSCGPTFAPDISSLVSPEHGDAISVSLPSPNAACNDDPAVTQAADLGGFRVPLRSFFVVLLWAGFFVKVAHSIGPGRSGIEPDPSPVGG